MDRYYLGHVGGRQWGKVEVKEGSQFDSREQHQSVWELNFIMEEHTGRASVMAHHVKQQGEKLIHLSLHAAIIL